MSAVLLVAYVVFAVALGEEVPGTFYLLVLNAAISVGAPVLTQRNLRRAIRLNSGPPQPAGE